MKDIANRFSTLKLNRYINQLLKDAHIDIQALKTCLSNTPGHL